MIMIPKYSVFSGSGKTIAVRHGANGLAFLFTFTWSFFNGIWPVGLADLLIRLMLAQYSIVALLLYVIVTKMLYFFFGSMLHRQHAIARGMTYIGTVDAPDKINAIKIAINDILES